MDTNYKPILVLYYKPTCQYCQKVLEFIEKNNIDLPLKNIEKDIKSNDELLHLGGKTQVPCLFIDGKALYNSTDIIDWLIKKHNVQV